MQFLNHKLYTELSILYSQSHRYYHNMSHINHCLGELEEFMAAKPDLFFLKREVTLALWFHDVVYNPYSKQNEENSVDIFKQWAKEQDFSSDEELIQQLILGTKHHNVLSEQNELEHNIVNDIDFASLGQPQNIFMKNSEDIRKEYSHITSENFKTGRLAFLNEMLSRKKIYQTDYFYNKYERQARRNISTSIRILLNQH